MQCCTYTYDKFDVEQKPINTRAFIDRHSAALNNSELTASAFLQVFVLSVKRQAYIHSIMYTLTCATDMTSLDLFGVNKTNFLTDH